MWFVRYYIHKMQRHLWSRSNFYIKKHFLFVNLPSLSAECWTEYRSLRGFQQRHGCDGALFAKCCRGAATRRANPSTAISDVFGEGAHRCVGGTYWPFLWNKSGEPGSGWCRNPAKNIDKLPTTNLDWLARFLLSTVVLYGGAGMMEGTEMMVFAFSFL